ncbi:MAG: ParB N-terminal domain-containing protein [Sedimentisphaerales bacterium]|nr:ParB N-terminal domain-containing protein [Sedimentisphaerales bacterium]
MNTEITHIALEQLVSHPDNPNHMSRASFAKLVRGIAQTGHYEPLVVRPHPDRAGCFQIINGQHRCDALRKLGYETADAVIWNVDDAQTAILLATLNRLGGRDSLEKKLTLLRRLRACMSIPDLAKLLPQTRGQLERLLSRRCLSPETPGSDSPFSVPVVFFVSEAQQEAIEKALRLATDEALPEDISAPPAPSPARGNTRAGRRAAALTCLANLFLDLTQQELNR